MQKGTTVKVAHVFKVSFCLIKFYIFFGSHYVLIPKIIFHTINFKAPKNMSKSSNLQINYNWLSLINLQRQNLPINQFLNSFIKGKVWLDPFENGQSNVINMLFNSTCINGIVFFLHRNPSRPDEIVYRIKLPKLRSRNPKRTSHTKTNSFSLIMVTNPIFS